MFQNSMSPVRIPSQLSRSGRTPAADASPDRRPRWNVALQPAMSLPGSETSAPNRAPKPPSPAVWSAGRFDPGFDAERFGDSAAQVRGDLFAAFRGDHAP